MNEIRVNSGIVVNVNDYGDTITVNAEDQLFVEKFFLAIEQLERIQKEMSEPEWQEKSKREQLSAMIERTKEIMSEMDGMFGDGTCKKVFGDIIPSVYLTADFYDQLLPIISRYADERQKKIAEKYSRKRKGGSKYRSKEEIIRDQMG